MPLTKRFEPEDEGTAILLTAVVSYQQTLSDATDSWSIRSPFVTLLSRRAQSGR